jgi:hypothetical protein
MLALGVAFAGSAVAAPPTPGYVGSAKSSVAGCPFIAWRLARGEGGAIHGISYYSDLSGLSQVSGHVDNAGKFQLTLKSVMGNGPVGTVTGSKSSKGMLEAEMKGQGCANMHIEMSTAPDLNNWSAFQPGGSG